MTIVRTACHTCKTVTSCGIWRTPALDKPCVACANCDPEMYNRCAEAQKNAWLSGNTPEVDPLNDPVNW